jgi:dimeric dUTPase (all-alpha-NTP-PPase superfamily)
MWSMNLEKLFSAQKVLRDRINYTGEDRFNKLVLALLVEIGECANEWRGFKFWSKNQEPARIIHTTAGATPENAVYFKCMNEDDCGEHLDHKDFENLFEPDYEECPKCKVGYVAAFRPKNPLLEEYVDGKHFIIELCIELGITAEAVEMFIQGRKGKIGSLEEHFGYLYNRVSSLMDTGSLQDKKWTILQVFKTYVGLGYRLGFTPEEVEQAYFDKNKVNHERQANGY